MPNHRNLPMVQIEGYRPFDVSTIEWIQMMPLKRFGWRWIEAVVLRRPMKLWRVIFKQPDSLLSRSVKPIFITEENKIWLDRQIESHNMICNLVTHRESFNAIYGGQK